MLEIPIIETYMLHIYYSMKHCKVMQAKIYFNTCFDKTGRIGFNLYNSLLLFQGCTLDTLLGIVFIFINITIY